MSGPHADLGPELRQLAQAILDRIDPALRGAAMMAAARAAGEPGRCQQVWCPVCALAALVTGEEHPLLNVIAEHSVALLTVIRALIDHQAEAGPPPPPENPEPPAEPEPPRGRYEPIPVTVEE